MRIKPQPILLASETPAEVVAQEAGTPASFHAQVYHGGPLRVPKYPLPVVIQIKGMRARSQMVANLDHDKTKRVGHITEAKFDSPVVMSGLLSARSPARDEVRDSAADGYRWATSIEALPDQEGLEHVGRNKTVNVNNRTIKGPVIVARSSEIYGFAFVTHGADAEASAEIYARNYDMTTQPFDRWLSELGFDRDHLTDSQLAMLEANFDGSGTSAPTAPNQATAAGGDGDPPDVSAGYDEAMQAFRDDANRQREITEIAAQFCRGSRDAAEIARVDDLGRQAIEENWNADQFRLRVLEASIPRGMPTFDRGRDRDRLQRNSDVMEAALIKAGNPQLAEQIYGGQDGGRLLEDVDRLYPNGIGLKQLMIECANANGLGHHGTDVTLDVQRAAFGLRGPDIQASMFSTVSLPGILSNTANRFLLNGWEGGDMSWSAIASTRPVRNFFEQSYYRLSGHMTYEKVGADGEIKHGTVSEDSYGNKADTYGRMFSITRRDIINDDLGALTQVPTELGMGAADKFNEIFWAEFMDNAAFFSAGNNNLITGATTALSIEGLAEAENAFLNQTKPNGQPLAVMGQVLLVPGSLWATARQLMNSTLVVSGEDRTQGNINVMSGQYRAVTNPYLENSLFTGNSNTAWYLISNPLRYSCIEAAFLNGRQAPFVETADASFNVLGVQMRGVHDFGVRKQEPRGGIKSAGA